MDVPRRTEAVGSTGLSPEPWERVVTISGLIAGLLALPLPPIASAPEIGSALVRRARPPLPVPPPPIARGPEIASTLAVLSVITLAGLRWGIAVLVVTE